MSTIRTCCAMVLACLVLSGCSGGGKPDPRAKRMGKSKSRTIEESASSQAVKTPAEKPPEPVPARPMPGVSNVELIAFLEKNGFIVEKKSSLGMTNWTCAVKRDPIERIVQIWGMSPKSISSINAQFIRHDGKELDWSDAASFLALVATTPYRDPEPAQTAEWIKANKAGGETAINGVVYRVEGSSKMLQLSMKAK
jgi:hypothetical protein